MSLVFAAITPHPPLLIPSIGKENLAKVSKTELALKKLEEELYLSKPNLIIIISPHGNLLANAFTINMCHEYQSDLRAFGDLSTNLKFKGDLVFPSLIKHNAKVYDLPITLISEKILDHGAVVPLYFLTQHLNAPIVPVGFSGLDAKTHFNFGDLLREQIIKTNQRVAVIASGDLSHALTTDAPAGFNPAGKEFDEKIRELLAAGNATGIMQFNENLVQNAAECGLRSIIILMGILHNINYRFESYSYECPFGVGYLTANFAL